MVAPQLVPEIWPHVFIHLRRGVPAPWKAALRSDFHQGDLASICRVSILFHNLAAPILYQSIIAPDLVTLLQGLGPKDTARSSRRIKRKVDLVGKTTDLRIVGLGPSIHTIPHLPSLLHGEDDWTQIGLARAENHKRVRRLDIQEMTRFHEITSDYNCPLERPHFQNLKRLILGQRFDHGWENLKERDEELVGFAPGVMDTFICAHQPKYICVNTSCGPYAPRMIIYDEEIRTWTTTRTISQAAKDARGIPVVTKHLYADGVSVPQVALGAVNRWIIPPGTVMHRTDGWDGFEVGSNPSIAIRRIRQFGGSAASQEPRSQSSGGESRDEKAILCAQAEIEADGGGAQSRVDTEIESGGIELLDSSERRENRSKTLA